MVNNYCFVYCRGQKENKNIQQRTFSSFITILLELHINYGVRTHVNGYELSLTVSPFIRFTSRIETTIPDKSVGTQSKFSPPPTFNVDNRVIFFPFLLEKTRYIFPTLIRGDGGYVIQLKCPNYFWPGLSERDNARNFPVRVTPAIVTASRYFRI